MDAQIKRGILEILVLFYLASSDYYGYDIMKRIQQYFPEVHDSTLYVILRRLHEEKLTEVYYGDTSSGPPRKYYRITKSGQQSLEKKISDWRELKGILTEIGIE